jgi:hypothetical protein
MDEVKRVKYDFARLQKYCCENGITLIGDYENEKLNKIFEIRGVCIKDCNNLFNKRFCELIKTGGYCPNCQIKIKQERSKKTCLEKYGTENAMKSEEVKNKFNSYKFTYEVLQKFCIENKIILIEDYANVKISGHYKIQGNCITENCKNIFSKEFYRLMLDSGYCKSCCITNAKEKRVNTNLKLYGVEYSGQNEEFKEKAKLTCLKKYGFEYPTQNADVQNKIALSFNKKYGVSHFFKSQEFKDNNKQLFLNKYGVEFPMQSVTIQNTCKTNCENRYGVSHPMQIPEIADKTFKNSFKTKSYIMPSGKTIKIQGYEPFAIDELLKVENIPEENIITGSTNVPVIWYEDIKGKKCRHYVDIFIPMQNRCIEVKSTWTAKKGKDYIFLKQEAAKKLGYIYEIWVYDHNGNRIEEYK